MLGTAMTCLPSTKTESPRQPACPTIIVYERIDALGAFIARYAIRKIDPKTKSEWWGFLPMLFSGETEEEVRTTASQFWADQTAKIEARRTGAAKARAARSGQSARQ
jgi:hypothetical protein